MRDYYFIACCTLIIFSVKQFLMKLLMLFSFEKKIIYIHHMTI